MRLPFVRQFTDACGPCRRDCFWRGHLFALHDIEHDGAPFACAHRITPWRVVAWRLWKSGEQRGLGERDIAYAFAEQILTGPFDAVDAIAKINRVQVALENCRLVERVFEQCGVAQFQQLARDAAFIGAVTEKHVAR